MGTHGLWQDRHWNEESTRQRLRDNVFMTPQVVFFVCIVWISVLQSLRQQMIKVCKLSRDTGWLAETGAWGQIPFLYLKRATSKVDVNEHKLTHTHTNPNQQKVLQQVNPRLDPPMAKGVPLTLDAHMWGRMGPAGSWHSLSGEWRKASRTQTFWGPSCWYHQDCQMIWNMIGQVAQLPKTPWGFEPSVQAPTLNGAQRIAGRHVWCWRREMVWQVLATNGLD